MNNVYFISGLLVGFNSAVLFINFLKWRRKKRADKAMKEFMDKFFPDYALGASTAASLRISEHTPNRPQLTLIDGGKGPDNAA